MARKSVIAFLCAAAAFVCSCNKEENLSTPPLSLEHSITLSAGAAGSDETRATFDKDGHFYWLPADAVGVATTESNSLSKLTLSESDAYKTTGSFSGNITGKLGDYAVYPYNENHKIEDKILTYYLPSTYDYLFVDKDYFTSTTTSYFHSANAPAYGELNINSNGEVYTTFNHLCGVLCLKFNSMPSNVGYITLTADRKITGNFCVDLSKSDSDSYPEIATTVNADPSNTERTVTINYQGATKNSPGVFYIPMPVGRYSLTLELGYNETLTDGTEIVRVTKAKSNTIARKDMVRMKVNYSTMANGGYVIYHGHKFVDLGLSDGIFWAETNVGAETSTDYGGYYLWEEAAAAAKSWGDKCSLPTKAQADELLKSCTFSEENSNARVTSQKTTNSIILPAAGFYYIVNTETGKYALDSTQGEGRYWTSTGSGDTQAFEFLFTAWALSSRQTCAMPRTGKNPVRPVLKVE
jgi:hypothetical protein